MDPPLHSRVKLAVSWVDTSRWKLSKVTKDANMSRQGFGLCILGCASYFVHRLPWERKNHQEWILYSIIGVFEGRNRQKMATDEEGKSALSPKQCTVSQVDCNYSKITWITEAISNCFCTHPILQIWTPTTTGCLHTSKGKEIWILWRSDIGNMHILRPKTNHSTKKALNC